MSELLFERLDRLPGAKQILRAASVFGRSFEPGGVAAIVDQESTAVDEMLRQLVNYDIMQERSAELIYGFRHSLLRVTAYESMILLIKREYHARVVKYLKTNKAQATPTSLEVLAQHLTGRNFEMM